MENSAPRGEVQGLHPAERLIFAPFISAFGGVERLILSLSRYLHDREIEHSVVCFRDSLGLASFANWPLTVRQLQGSRNWAAEVLRLRRYLDANASPDRPLLAFDLKGAFYAGPSGFPFSLHLTDPPSLLSSDVSKEALSLRAPDKRLRLGDAAKLPRFARAEAVHRINRFGARRATRTFVMTNAIAAEVRRLYGVTPTVLRPGVALPAMARASKTARTEDARRFRVLSICRLEKSKRIDWIIRALANLGVSSDESPSEIDWGFDVVGDGSAAKELAALTRSLGLEERITFHGYLQEEGIELLYREADLFVMPASQGWGLPALEALARRVPVVVHQDSGVSEILANTPWAEIVSGNDGSDLSGAINRMFCRTQTGELAKIAPPAVPTDVEWARDICTECGWR